jgi:hypothetical protein
LNYVAINQDWYSQIEDMQASYQRLSGETTVLSTNYSINQTAAAIVNDPVMRLFGEKSLH